VAVGVDTIVLAAAAKQLLAKYKDRAASPESSSY